MLANAKVNLSLHVTGKRPDGYHLLQSLVMFAGVGDELTLTPATAFSLKIEGPCAGSLKKESVADNLVSRVVQALAEDAGKTPDAALTLVKKLPIGAGLGGGSADAAAALRILDMHWQTQYLPGRLAAIGAKIGSDIAACVHNKPVWMEGAGERIALCDIPFDIPVLLVNPGIPVATKDVYAHLVRPFDVMRELPRQFMHYEALLEFLHSTRNSLQDAAVAIAPKILALLSQLETLEGCQLARMSGSGSTCFALFDNHKDCEKAAAMLYSRHPDYWVRSTKLLGSHHG